MPATIKRKIQLTMFMLSSRFTAFSKSAWSAKNQPQGLRTMRRKVTACFSDVIPTSVAEQAHSQVVEDGQDLCCTWGLQARGIFMKGDIAPIMQAVLNAPMPPTQAQ